MAQSKGKKWTTVTVTKDVHSDLERAKPYESMSYDEFLRELIEDHELGGGSNDKTD